MKQNFDFIKIKNKEQFGNRYDQFNKKKPNGFICPNGDVYLTRYFAHDKVIRNNFDIKHFDSAIKLGYIKISYNCDCGYMSIISNLGEIILIPSNCKTEFNILKKEFSLGELPQNQINALKFCLDRSIFNIIF